MDEEVTFHFVNSTSGDLIQIPEKLQCPDWQYELARALEAEKGVSMASILQSKFDITCH